MVTSAGSQEIRPLTAFQVPTSGLRRSKWTRFSSGEPMDNAYFFKTVVHEYSSIVLEQITRSKRKGWTICKAPSWFVQGYQEYLALTLSSDHSRTVTVSLYKDLCTRDPTRVHLCGPPDKLMLTVKNDYVDGAVLLMFMHEEFGRDRVHALLKSDSKTFCQALATELGLDYAGLFRRWQKWLSNLQRAR